MQSAFKLSRLCLPQVLDFSQSTQASFFFPIADGKTDIVALLLDIGADPTAWPDKEIGTPYSPVEFAAKEGHQAIVDLLVAHGAARPNERNAIQWRFVQAASFDSIELLKELLKRARMLMEQGMTMKWH
jgi:ankyrin repeat protein